MSQTVGAALVDSRDMEPDMSLMRGRHRSVSVALIAALMASILMITELGVDVLGVQVSNNKTVRELDVSAHLRICKR